jgi:hypothetical protein
MKAVIITFYLSLFPIAFVYSQSKTDLACNLNLEEIFKVFDYKTKYDIIRFIYQEKKDNRELKKNWSRYFYSAKIRGFPMAFEEQKGSMSNEEFNKYIEHCTQEQALKEYKDVILDIKSEKEKYLKCIDAELARIYALDKDDSLKYAKKSFLGFYNFNAHTDSWIEPPGPIGKLKFLKIFREFILIDNEEILPEGRRAHAYLKYNRKIP